MAVYRNIQTTFWTDAKITDDFTPEDKYFYLYLFTNPHTNLCGCYELSKKQASWETGYSEDTIDRLIDRFTNVHKVISYNSDTRELLLINWHKYNWTSSDKFRKPLLKEIESIRCEGFREYLTHIFEDGNTVSIPYQYGMDTTVTDTVTDTVSDTVSDSDIVTAIKVKKSITDKCKDMVSESELSEELKNKIIEWIEYKVEIKKSYKSETGFKTFLKKIGEYTLNYTDKEIIDVIDLSMSNGYQGVIWDKISKPSNNNSAYMDAIKNRVNVVDTWL